MVEIRSSQEPEIPHLKVNWLYSQDEVIILNISWLICKGFLLYSSLQANKSEPQQQKTKNSHCFIQKAVEDRLEELAVLINLRY